MNHNQRSFEADNIVDALVQVRNHLGPNAIILETRRVNRYPFWSLGSKKVRVVAESQDNSSAKLNEVVSELKSLRTDFGMMKTDWRECYGAGQPVTPVNKTAEKAGKAGLSQEGVKKLSEMLGAKVPGTDQLAKLLTAQIRTIDVLKVPGPVMLVGTTGVGKTTTIAKLAAAYSLNEGKSAVLISRDSFRIGGMDQLKTYADLLSLPFEPVFAGNDLKEAVKKHADKDAILIDTAGHGLLDSKKIDELRQLKTTLPAMRTLLTISLAQARDARRILDNFSALEPCGLIVTKLDETSLQWGLFDILRSTNLPLAFVTSGQHVPEDIAKADAKTLAAMLSENLLEARR